MTKYTMTVMLNKCYSIHTNYFSHVPENCKIAAHYGLSFKCCQQNVENVSYQQGWEEYYHTKEQFAAIKFSIPVELTFMDIL